MLSFNLYKKTAADKYTKFDIPKRYGGTRNICAPLKELKIVQQRLSVLLQNCAQEIDKANGRSDDDKRPDRIAHGFKRERSIMTNAKEHRARKYVFNVDLKDFFGTINFGRVRGFFLKEKNFALHPRVATVLAQIACYENKLPQGSPCSPVISNLIAHVLDIHLVQLASNTGCTYTRYADDLTFSTNKRDFPSSISKRSKDEGHTWIPGKELARLVEKNGFELNATKTRMQYRDSRQDVTGLVVNRKVNVSKEYRHTVRAMVHSLFTNGTFSFKYKVKDEKGITTVKETPGQNNQLQGMLAYIWQVEIYNRKIRAKSDPIPQNNPGRERLYRLFLFFDAFYSAKVPVIICEGKTDNVYLLHAIRSLVAHYPQLGTKDMSGAIKLNVRILKYFDTNTGRILGMHGGVAGLTKFMNQYHYNVRNRFKAPGALHPIIMLIDNDSGLKGILKAATKISKKKTTGKEPFIHVTSNLYVVPTPITPGVLESKIEDFFDATTLATPVDGKLFDPDKDMDTDLHYGKVVFAHKVVRANAETIDFSEFKAILDAVVSVIDEHAKTHAIPLLVAQQRL